MGPGSGDGAGQGKPHRGAEPSVHLSENFCCRKLRLTEEDSLCPFIRLQEKKKQAQQMQKTLEEKEEVRRVAGSWWWLGWLVVSWRVAAHRRLAAGTGAMPCSLWPCQAFRERMKAIACQWRDLQIKEAQLKAYMKKSRRVLQVQLPLLSSASTTPGCTTSSCPPSGRDPGGTAVCPHLH